MKKRFGYFTDNGREFVITTYNLPRPWINILSNGRYGFLVSHTGGGFSWLIDCNLNRITKWYQDVFRDMDGRYLYIKDIDKNEYWSPTYKPVMKKLDYYECRHGLGYTVIKSRYRGIETEITYFVPRKESMEIWIVRLKNMSKRKRNLEIYTFLEWWLGTIYDIDRQFHGLFYDLWVKDNIMFVTKYFWTGFDGSWNRSWNYIAFLTSSLKAISFEGCREKFIGENRSIVNPETVEKGECYQTIGRGFEPVGVFKYFITLNPGEEKRFTILIGVGENEDRIKKIVKKFIDFENAFRELKEVKKFWLDLLCKTTVETPDKYVNYLVNYWYKYQTISARILSRNAYYQQAAAYGFRDQLQDTLTLLLVDYGWAKRQIIEHAKHQFSDGGVMHWWHEHNDQGMISRHSDTPLWLVFMVINYIKETGDYKFLEEIVPFYDKGEASIFTHCELAIKRVLKKFGRRGLPLFLSGDWNDGFNGVGIKGKAESSWLAEFLYLILNEFSTLCKIIGKNRKAVLYRNKAKRLRKNFNEKCWDGKWYLRGFTDENATIGSHRNKEGKIFLNAQSWAVISGIAPRYKARKAIISAEKMLDTKYGPALFLPAYKNPDEKLGYISRYAPGTKENAGIFMHAVTWMMIAECILGRANKAYKIYIKTCPAYRGLDPNRSKTEPYVVSEWIAGPDSQFFGEGWNSWLTGSAAWSLRVVLDHILGIKATYDGLKINPCIPRKWKKINVKRYFRGSIYEISINNPHRLSRGIERIIVDGKQIKGDIIPLFNDGKTHYVEVFIE
ncbi:MAG: glycosyl transferase family 36 [Thermoprotei archaeon]|nr:MAG: glycosyl transferase family 36 [Thermoprotei archaeon]